ncbi:triggering receptor expressed on myeloid cells 1-like [Monodelphis domestica]|uniref:triggering receptor expressed on myeloid cells 1-like n=1 Tax=Monodelphis domestica TaxID=13616 RepID=UPI00028BEB3D|nr:triggering receptor expressed on myeloid cells 1-like [Monodelphis domestica]
MVREAPLLLFLLFLEISGSKKAETIEEYTKEEGQTLNVNCSYRPWNLKREFNVWCKLQENGKDCNKYVSIRKNSVFTKEGKFFFNMLDEPKSGKIIIIMSGLRVKDSGHYLCVVIEQNAATVLKKIHLEVTPVQSTTKGVSNTSKVHQTTVTTYRKKRDPGNPSLSEKEKFIILGMALPFLLLLGVLIIGIVYIKKLHQKVRKGDNFQYMCDNSEYNMQKPRDPSMEMDNGEDPRDIHYASLNYIGPRESMHTNILKGYNSKTMQIPHESVEYASILRTGFQHPKSNAPVGREC